MRSAMMLHSLGTRFPDACNHVKQCCLHTSAACIISRSSRVLNGLLLTSVTGARLLATNKARSRLCVNSQSLDEVRESLMAQRRALRELPTAAYGQVISAQANFVRVHITHLDTASGTSSSSDPTSSVDHGQQQQQQQQQLEDEQLAARQASNGHASSSSSSSGSSEQLTPPRTQLLCTVRALLKKINQRVLVGDRVRVYGIDWAEGRGVVESVQQRSSELADPAIANVDHVLLLFGLTQPPFEPAQVSRFLVSVSASGLPVTLALNKCDLLSESEVQGRLEQAASWGYDAVAVSCETGQGLDELARRLAGITTVVAGPSGAGKSSLINALRLGKHKPDATGGMSLGLEVGRAAALCRDALSQQVQQGNQQQLQQQELAGTRDTELEDCVHNGTTSISDEPSTTTTTSSSSSSSVSSSGKFLAVGEVSKIGRGKHTTRTVSLIELPFGSLMADTPGFNQPTLDRISSADLDRLFPEFVSAIEAQGGCRFTDCLHIAEPGCAVTAQELERYEHYVKFLTEIKVREEYDVRVMQLAKQRREGTMKVVTGKGGVTRYEARLDSKKHRNTSRKRVKQELWDHKDS